MDIWKYYDGDLKYPELGNYSHEKDMAKTNPKWAFEHILKHGKDKELEPIIAKSAKYSYEYAIQILEDAFKLGEPEIAKSSIYSYMYATDILNGKPFKLGEPAIAKDASFSFMYASDILNGKRFKLGEPAIAKDADSAIEYALFILKKPWKEAEAIIAKVEFDARQYTQLVLKRDFYLDGKLICEYDEDEDEDY